MKIFRRAWLVLIAGVVLAQMVMAANDVPTGFSMQGGIINTRHNMSQSTLTDTGNGGAGMMNASRNRYGEVCVYCHTPHGANTSAAVPLWNRSIPTISYTTYDQLNTSTLTQTVYQPGAASLPCLSCHDGTQAIDAIINMPGSGGYSATPDPTKWVPKGAGTGKSSVHRYMGPGALSCMSCHNSTDPGYEGIATDFEVFVVGTDLRNMHPIGVKFPTAYGGDTDWNAPSGTITKGSVVSRFFDDNNNGRMDKQEIRMYDSGNGATVECASCHDPHGVPSTDAGSVIRPTFLRKSNDNSSVCMTCHNK